MTHFKIENWYASEQATELRSLDRHLAGLIAHLGGSDIIQMLAALVSYELGKGNVCLNLSPTHRLLPSCFTSQSTFQSVLDAIKASELISYCELSENPDPRSEAPLVFDGTRLYLQRYWQYEVGLGFKLKQRLSLIKWPEKLVKKELSQLFQLQPKMQLNASEIDWQAVAVCIAATHQFSVISGGPGTGKTTTVIRLLALLVSLYQQTEKRIPIINLAAPTGKAAMRLSESIKGAKKSLNAPEHIKEAIPEEASTLHRLLQQRRDGTFHFNVANLLHVDVLIIDEASMVDLPMMYRVVSALPESAQLILLGDKDQLASVEAGSVLADICNANDQQGYSRTNSNLLKNCLTLALPQEFLQDEGALIRDHLCQLYKSYRFHENSGIGHLAKAANAGDFNHWKAITARRYDDISIQLLNEDTYTDLHHLVVKGYETYLKKVATLKENSSLPLNETALVVHRQFSQFQVLSATREGMLGVSGLNDSIESTLLAKGLIRMETDTTHASWYAGRPIMVMENDYSVELFNGDIGIAIPVEDEISADDTTMAQGSNVRLMISFVTADGKIRWIKPSRLPRHETVYAMTVHKSQGSEFDHCVLVLPERNVQVLTKELIYTGITRAKKQLHILADESVLKNGLLNRVHRASGLKDRLWGSEVTVTSLKTDARNHTDNNDETGTQFTLF